MNLKVILLMLLAGFAAQLNAAAIILEGNETLTVDSGDNYLGVHMSDNSTATILSGTIDFGNFYTNSTVEDDSIITILGGNITGQIIINENALIQLSGSNFTIGNTSISTGTLDLEYLTDIGALSYNHSELDQWDGTISGILDDGSYISFDFSIVRPVYRGDSWTANIEILPEPLSLCLLGLGGLVTIKRRK